MELIRQGDAGPDVEDIQRRLEAAGLACTDPPGEFGPATVDAVRQFQQGRGLTADGIVGDETWRALVESGFRLGDRLLYSTQPMLRGDDVRELQRRLTSLGFDTRYVDGILGPLTAQAVEEFQRNVGAPVDGIAGQATVAVLRRLARSHQQASVTAVRERQQLERGHRTSLAGVRILVDPAHGPGDPGFVGIDGIQEDEVTWAIAALLAGRLSAAGAKPVLSRGPATTPSVSERAALANREDVDAIISIHGSGLDSAIASGACGFYFGHEGYASDPGHLLADLCVDAVVAATGTAHCRTHPSTASILRESRAPAAIIEPGFLTHPDEGQAMGDPEVQRVIAGALVEALSAFLVRGSSGEAADAGPATHTSIQLPETAAFVSRPTTS